MNMPGDDRPSLVLQRRLKARPATVWRAWTDPDRILRWWGTEGAQALEATCDLRIGGRFRVVFRSADGESHDVSGVYREIVPDRRLVFSWAWRTTPERESQVTLELEPAGDGTLLTLTHERFADEKASDDHRGGWNEALERLSVAIIEHAGEDAHG